MKKINKRILSLPGWIPLLIMVLTPVCLDFIGFNNISIYGVIQIIIFYFWIYLASLFLYEDLGDELKAKINISNFKTLYIFSLILFIFSPVIGGIIALIMSSLGAGSLITTILAGSPLLIGLIVFIELSKFSAKILVSNERNKLANYKEYFETLILYIFFPFGIIFLQNRVRKIFLKDLNDNKRQLRKEKIIVVLALLIFALYNVFLSLPNYYFATAGKYMEEGKVDSAKKFYNLGLFLKPNSIEGNFNLGKIFHDKGENENAIKQYLKVLEIDPYDKEANNNLGNIYHDQGKLKDAIELYNKVLEKYPEDKALNINLGDIYLEQRNFEEAYKYYKEALKTNNNEYNGHIYYNIACIYALTNNKTKALESLEKAISIDKNSSKDAKNDKDFRNIYNDVKFKELIEKIE